MRLASESMTAPMSRLLRAAIADRRLRITHQSTGRPPCTARQRALLPHRLGVERGPHDLEGIRTTRGQKVKIDEAVVERREAGCRHGMASRDRWCSLPGVSDDGESRPPDQHRLERRLEAAFSSALVARRGTAGMHRLGQVDALAFDVSRAVLRSRG